MTTTIERKREAFGDAPIVRLVMRRDSFDVYRASQAPAVQADLDAMVTAGTLVVRESSG